MRNDNGQSLRDYPSRIRIFVQATITRSVVLSVKEPEDLQCFIVAFSLKTKSATRTFNLILPGPSGVLKGMSPVKYRAHLMNN